MNLESGWKQRERQEEREGKKVLMEIEFPDWRISETRASYQTQEKNAFNFRFPFNGKFLGWIFFQCRYTVSESCPSKLLFMSYC